MLIKTCSLTGEVEGYVRQHAVTPLVVLSPPAACKPVEREAEDWPTDLVIAPLLNFPLSHELSYEVASVNLKGDIINTVVQNVLHIL